jgi:HK97 family phage prohead protease
LKIDLNKNQIRSAPIEKSAIDEENRKISFILVSEQNEGMRKPCCEEPYIERLDVNGADTSNLRTFFKDHTPNVDNAVGRVENIRVEDNKLKADVIFGTDEDSQKIFQKYRDGILSDVSIGYRIKEYEVDESKDIPVVTIKNFEVYEVSAVGIGFDKGAKMGRSAENNETTPKVEETDEIRAELPPQNKDLPKGDNRMNKIMRLARGYIADGKDAIAVMDLATRMSEEGKSATDFAMAVLEMKRETQPNVVVTPQKESNKDEFKRVLEDAILLRSGIEVKNPHEDANKFRNYSLRDMVGRYLDKPYMDNNELKRAFVSSDFPNIMMNVINKAIIQKWELAPTTFDKLTRSVEVKDFKDNYAVNMGDIDFDYFQKTELSKMKNETIDDMSMKWGIDLYGKKLQITTKTIINDDLGLVMDFVNQYTEGAKFFLNACYWEAVTGLQFTKEGKFKNYKLPLNNKTLFDSANKNTITDDFSEEALDKLLLLMQDRTNKTGNPLRITPKNLIVPASLDRPAKKIIRSSTTYSDKGDYNPYENIVDIMYEPLLNKDESKAYYLSADRMTGTIGFLAGTNKRPVVELRDKSFADGIDYDFSLAFGILLEDYRSFARGGK